MGFSTVMLLNLRIRLALEDVRACIEYWKGLEFGLPLHSQVERQVHPVTKGVHEPAPGHKHLPKLCARPRARNPPTSNPPGLTSQHNTLYIFKDTLYKNY